MPRVKDIAWKFVTRLGGEKWHCPHCETEYSGKVTRVKSHFLKHPNKGISPCKKVPEHISMLMDWLHDQDCNREDIAWKFVDRLEDNKWRCHYCSVEFFGDLTGVKGHLLKAPIEGISICTEVPHHIRKLMWSLLDEVAEEESREVAEGQIREANRQSSAEPQSHDMPTQAEVEAEEESREATGQFSTDAFFSPGFLEYMERLNFSQQVQNSHVQPVLVPPQHQNVPHQSETRNVLQNPTAPSSTALMDIYSCIPSSSQAPNNAPPGATEISNFNQQDIIGVNSYQQSQVECQFPQSSTMLSLVRNSHGESTSCSTEASGENVLYLLDSPHQSPWSFPSPCLEEMPTNGQQIPIGSSSFQYNQLPATGDSHCFLDSNQHSPMDIDPSIASRHTSDPPIVEATINDSQVPKGATNTIGPPSSQDMNRGSPIMNVRSIYANDEEIRNLKRKMEELNDKETFIKEQMEIEPAASSARKKPRMLAGIWLKETERARNNFQIIGQANVETLPPKEQVETLTREVEELIEQTTLLIDARDVKVEEFLVRKLIGEAIHRNIELIWDRLKENHACKLGIYGMGGVGKTTIMMHIYNRLLKDATFNGVIFITVSQDCSIYKLQSDIWKALGLGVMEDEHEKKRAAKLSKCLARKKNCVLILDDVWEGLDLEEAGIPSRANGFKLVLTTRSFDVCCQMQCQEKIKIEPLSQKEAMDLFMEELGSEVTHNLEIKVVLNSIVRECAGLPIGVITMAKSMRGVTNVFEWRDSLGKLEASSMGQTDMEKKVLMHLKFSYDRLGNLDEQQCFLSCALYPEDELIDKFELVEFFIDQGLFGGLNTRKKQYDRGLTILNKLGNVCLLENHGHKMKMHDLIRDMALYIMSATAIVKVGEQLRNIPLEEYWTDTLEKVSLIEDRFIEFPLNMSPNCPKLSTLLLKDCLLSNVVIPDSFFKNLLGLKVLNLSGSNMTELPNSISDLVNLRAVLLRNCRELHCIPYLGKLTSLRKLDARDCRSLEQAPKGLGMLVNLRYLDLTKTCIGRLPKGTLDHLLNLQCLKVSVVNEEDITKLGALETLNACLKMWMISTSV